MCFPAPERLFICLPVESSSGLLSEGPEPWSTCSWRGSQSFGRGRHRLCRSPADRWEFGGGERERLEIRGSDEHWGRNRLRWFNKRVPACRERLTQCENKRLSGFLLVCILCSYMQVQLITVSHSLSVTEETSCRKSVTHHFKKHKNKHIWLLLVKSFATCGLKLISDAARNQNVFMTPDYKKSDTFKVVQFDGGEEETLMCLLFVRLLQHLKHKQQFNPLLL